MLSMIGPYWPVDEPNVVGVAYGQYSPSILRPNPLIDRSQSADNGDVIAALTSPGHCDGDADSRPPASSDNYYCLDTHPCHHYDDALWLFKHILVFLVHIFYPWRSTINDAWSLFLVLSLYYCNFSWIKKFSFLKVFRGLPLVSDVSDAIKIFYCRKSH